jgi:hypothetical protein
VGDSNITLAGTQIALALTNRDHGYVPVIFTKPGAAIRSQDCSEPAPCPTWNYWEIRLGQGLPKVGSDVFVVNLGINDTNKLGTSGTQGYSNYDNKIDWFMKLLPSTRPVLWTNLPCSLEPESRKRGCMIVNYALGQAQSRWPNLTVLNWAAVAAGHPEYMVNPGNDVHYSFDGVKAWSELVAAAVDTRLPEP